MARGVIEWLKHICEDVLSNIAIVLDEVGVLPFIIILSMWNVTESVLLLAQVIEPVTVFQSKHADPPSASTFDVSRLQSHVAKLLKQLMCGTYSDPYNMTHVVSRATNTITTATGFTVTHLSTFLNFIGKTARYGLCSCACLCCIVNYVCYNAACV